MRTLHYLVARSERAIAEKVEAYPTFAIDRQHCNRLSKEVRPDDVSICPRSSYSSRFHPLLRMCSNSFKPSLIMLLFEFGELGDASALLIGVKRKLYDLRDC